MTPTEFVVDGSTNVPPPYLGWGTSTASLRFVDIGGVGGDLVVRAESPVGRACLDASVVLRYWRFHQPAPTVCSPEFRRETSRIAGPLARQNAPGHTVSSTIIIVSRTLSCCA